MEFRRLHVWEHPDLHRGDPNPPLGSEPVHVIYEPHEFDWWVVDQLGDLHIGYLGSQPLLPTQQPGELTQIYVTQTHMARGMFAKVYEETFAEVPSYEPPVASMPIATVEPVASGTMTGDDTTLLPIVSRGEEYEVERSSPFPPLEPDDPHRAPDEPEPEPELPDKPDEPEVVAPVKADRVEAAPPPPTYLPPVDILPLDATRLDILVPRLGLMASGNWPSPLPPVPRSRVPKGKKRRRRAVVR